MANIAQALTSMVLWFLQAIADDRIWKRREDKDGGEVCGVGELEKIPRDIEIHRNVKNFNEGVGRETARFSSRPLHRNLSKLELIGSKQLLTVFENNYEREILKDFSMDGSGRKPRGFPPDPSIEIFEIWEI